MDALTAILHDPNVSAAFKSAITPDRDPTGFRRYVEAERARLAARTPAQIREDHCAWHAERAVERAEEGGVRCSVVQCWDHPAEWTGRGEGIYGEAYADAAAAFDAAVIVYRAAMVGEDADSDAGYLAVGDDDLAQDVAEFCERGGV